MSPVDNCVDKVLKSLCLQRFLLGISCGVNTAKTQKVFIYQANLATNLVGKN
jgi:hypothetical protein